MSNSGLQQAVDEFVDAVMPVMDEVTDGLPTAAGRYLRDDLVTEAFNIAAAFVDADQRHTETELWAVIEVFGGHFGGQLVRATPTDVRDSGLLAGRRHWLNRPSALFDLLVAYDRRHGTTHALTYYDRALRIGFTIAGMDRVTTDAELSSIDRFRRVLLQSMPGGGLGHDDGGTPTSGVPAGTTGSGATVAEKTAPEAEARPPDPPPRPLEELLAELDELVGLDDVKAEVRLVAALIQVQNLRHERKLPVMEQSRHLVFTGNPGTGKTTVSRLVAQIFRTLGVVERGHLVETDRSHLVAGFVGQTAIKVREVFDEAEQGVLLIDEAYALARGGENDFGREAIDTVVKLIEDRRDRLVVIAAGYPDEMNEFIDANPGLRSRFPKTIHFPDYSTDELMHIFETLGERGGYHCDAEATDEVRAWFDAEPRTKGFGNGRVARNLFEAAVARQATRVVRIDDPTDEELTTLVAADIPDRARRAPSGSGPSPTPVPET
jgi:Cdc6-like AAA superfamily ATPase